METVAPHFLPSLTTLIIVVFFILTTDLRLEPFDLLESTLLYLMLIQAPESYRVLQTKQNVVFKIGTDSCVHNIHTVAFSYPCGDI